MAPVIAVENLSKKYIIGHQKQESYTALRDVLAEGAKRFANKLFHPFAAPQTDPTHEEFWALKDVSFDIQQGDRVGDYAEGKDSGIIDLVLVGDIDQTNLADLVAKTEKHIGRKIRTLVVGAEEFAAMTELFRQKPILLLWENGK